MSAEAKFVRVSPPLVDPAGADKLLLAVGEACSRWLEQRAARVGLKINLWDGADGLRSVAEQAIKEAGIPNKRFLELVTPRAVAEVTGLVKPKRRLRKA